MKYTYLGPEGTFSEAALLSVPEAAEAERIPSHSVPAALSKVRQGEVDAAMVPIENSVEGGVTATLDAIAAGDDLRIVGEVLVPIRFILVGAPGIRLDEVRVVSTHSHAWAQVRGWMEETLPGADYVPASSTAAAAVALLDGTPDYDAAVCSPIVADHHPELNVLATDIGDNANAITRFVLVTAVKGGLPTPAPTGADKTTVVIPLPKDRAGALMDLLEQFAARGVNLSRIESRPTGEALGMYFFSIDAEGHVDNLRMRHALRGLHRVSPGVKFLGSYPRADGRKPIVDPHHTDEAFARANAWVDGL
ncbi:MULTISPECIES: prephenate dehydratase [Kocuria]|uniref:prephenate dehydratase n=1 Tax=Kocuria TaxID=57493 RepID=UPI00065FF440|nr:MULTISPECIES: prephenate dehydratase [Kocuria]RUQ20666.1 prephenate dehydratase [Kocuria sp. HSID16901]